MNRYAGNVRQNVFMQAGVTALLLLLPSYEAHSGWRTVSYATVAGCVAVGLYIHSGSAGAYEVTIIWEAGVVLVDGYGLSQNHYMVGALMAVVILLGLLNAHARALFYARPAAPKQTQQPTVPAQWSPPAAQPTPVPYGAGSIPPPPPAGWRPPPPAWPPAQR